MPSKVTFKNENIICFAGEDWWFHNPHSNFHIMKSFAKNNRVLFVNSTGIRMPSFSNDKYVWKRIMNKLKSFARYLVKAEENIYVFTPLALPLTKKFGGVVRVINKFLLIVQFNIVLFLLNFRNPLIWVTSPAARDIVLYLKKRCKKCVYYCCDNLAHFPGVDKEYIERLETDIQKNSDISFFVNNQLMEERKAVTRVSRHTEHGVDYEHFAQCLDKKLPIPDDIKNIKTPIVGYMGEIQSLDLDLIVYLAKKEPNFSFVFVGEVYTAVSDIALPSNVYFFGKRAYDLLPNYLQMFACCCLYYKMDDIFNKYRNPKKLMEYLATGKPVISVGIIQMKAFKDYVYIAENYEEFHACLVQAVSKTNPVQIEKRRMFAQQHTWDNVALRIMQNIIR